MGNCWRKNCKRRPARRVRFHRDGLTMESCDFHFNLMIKGRVHFDVETL